MNFQQKLLSFEGRMGRQDFWICTLILIVASIAVNIVVGILLGAVGMGAAPMAVDPSNPEAASAAAMAAMGPAMLASGLVGLILLWPSLAIAVKRHHDRDQSGWMCLIFLIPVIGFLWWLINLGILDGTPGPNKYGPSPKGLEAMA